MENGEVERWSKEGERWSKEVERWSKEVERWSKEVERWSKEGERWSKEGERWSKEVERWSKRERGEMIIHIYIRYRSKETWRFLHFSAVGQCHRLQLATQLSEGF